MVCLQRFKAALHYNIGKICEELGLSHVTSDHVTSYDCFMVHCSLHAGAGESEELQFSSEVMAAINETAYNYAGATRELVGGS